MIDISIVGKRDGNHPFSIERPVSDVPGLGSEFIGSVRTEGVLRKLGSRYTVEADVEGLARLTCDRSLEEFDEPLTASIDLQFVVDNDLALSQRGRIADLDDEEVRGLREEEKAIDITEDVRQVLTLSVPFRKVAPAYRDKELEDIHPAMRERGTADADGSEPIDERWAALKNLKRS